MKETEVIDYLRKSQISSKTLFGLWVYSILPCWFRGHRASVKDHTKFMMGKTVKCMKCNKRI